MDSMRRMNAYVKLNFQQLSVSGKNTGNLSLSGRLFLSLFW